MTAMFADRAEAGRALAAELTRLGLADPVVLALPPGGVPVAVEVARALEAPIDLLLVRKVAAPGNPELCVAAIVDGTPPDIVINREIVEAYGLDDDALRLLVKEDRPESDQGRAVYANRRRQLSVRGKTVVLVDDGAATGTTATMALRALRRREPGAVVFAVPVAPAEVADELAAEADRVVCLSRPARFRALGFHYRDFPELSHDEVVELMKSAHLARKAALTAKRREG